MTPSELDASSGLLSLNRWQYLSQLII